jgi:hypothetical protein
MSSVYKTLCFVLNRYLSRKEIFRSRSRRPQRQLTKFVFENKTS